MPTYQTQGCHQLLICCFYIIELRDLKGWITSWASIEWMNDSLAKCRVSNWLNIKRWLFVMWDECFIKCRCWESVNFSLKNCIWKLASLSKCVFETYCPQGCWIMFLYNAGLWHRVDLKAPRAPFWVSRCHAQGFEIKVDGSYVVTFPQLSPMLLEYETRY